MSVFTEIDKRHEVEYSADSRKLGRLFGKYLAFFLGPQPVGNPEFLLKLTQALVFYAIKYVSCDYKDNKAYRGVISTNQKGRNEPYSDRNKRNNLLCAVRSEFERFPFIEFRLINARKIGSAKFFKVPIKVNIHFWASFLKSSYHRFQNRINAIRRCRLTHWAAREFEKAYRSGRADGLHDVVQELAGINR